MSAHPTSPDLQAEAERVFADVQRAVLVEDAKQAIAKALRAAIDAERARCDAACEAEYERRMANVDGYPFVRVWDFIVSARSIQRTIRAGA